MLNGLQDQVTTKPKSSLGDCSGRVRITFAANFLYFLKFYRRSELMVLLKIQKRVGQIYNFQTYLKEWNCENDVKYKKMSLCRSDHLNFARVRIFFQNSLYAFKLLIIMFISMFDMQY